jgi:DNA-binding NtrC family response regulator
MEVTETARKLSDTRAAQRTLRLLYTAEAGVLSRSGELLEPGGLPIGRAVEKGLSLPDDRRASRHHATLIVEREPDRSSGESPAAVRIVDNQSKNGTFVNGARIQEIALQDGDVIRIGDSLFLFRIDPVAALLDRPIAGLIGTSPAMRALRREIHQFAPTQSAVLLLGETGTGKEVCAQALHRLSPRSHQPLVVVDCGAVPRSLIESELFGHEAGAFTSAQRSRIGLFEQANGGTLFIDEIGELPIEQQPVLLRALEQGTVRRVGGSAPIRFDVRVIVATNRELSRMVAAQTFRGDLYARMAELIIRLPPLSARREDILELLLHALSRSPSGGSTRSLRLTPDLAEALLLHPFPFNVREVVKLAGELLARAAGSDLLTLSMLEHRLQRPPAPAAEPERPPPTPDAASLRRGRESAQLDREGLGRILSETQGSISEVARRLGCSRKQVYRYLEMHGLNPSKYR